MRQPFIQSNAQDGRISYHDLARELFCRHFYQHAEEDYYTARNTIASYYVQHLIALQGRNGHTPSQIDQWKEVAIALIQQAFLLPEEQSHLLGLEYAIRFKEYSEQAEELMKVLHLLLVPKPTQRLSDNARNLIEHILFYLEEDATNHFLKPLAAMNALFDVISHTPTFSPEVTAYVYRQRGRIYRLLGDYQQSLVQYNQALILLPQYGTAYAGRGEIYHQMKHYPEALTDFDRALFLNPDNDWTIQGEIYRAMEHYPEALADFDRALTLTPEDAWALGSRGQTYKSMGYYVEALADLEHAIFLDNQSAWLIAERGETYRLMERYPEALADFDRALTLAPEYAWVLVSLRGETYRSMKRYPEALADFDRALTLNEKDNRCWYDRALTYKLMNQENDFRQNILEAISIARPRLNAISMNSSEFFRIRFNIALYLLVADAIEEASAEYMQLLSICENSIQLQNAADDLKEYFTLLQQHEGAQQILHAIEARIKELTPP